MITAKVKNGIVKVGDKIVVDLDPFGCDSRLTDGEVLGITRVTTKTESHSKYGYYQEELTEVRIDYLTKFGESYKTIRPYQIRCSEITLKSV